MNKVYQMWYSLFIYYDFATVVNPFFRAVLIISGGCNSMFEEQDEKLVESLKKFWESESVGIITQDHSLHADKQKPEIHFNGHNYEIGLPWKEDLQPSMNSYQLSETQL